MTAELKRYNVITEVSPRGAFYGDMEEAITGEYVRFADAQAAIAAAISGAAVAAGNKIVEIAKAANPDQSLLKLQILILRVDMEKAVKASIPTDATTALAKIKGETE
jgi:hypothetical protein